LAHRSSGGRHRRPPSHESGSYAPVLRGGLRSRVASNSRQPLQRRWVGANTAADVTRASVYLAHRADTPRANAPAGRRHRGRLPLRRCQCRALPLQVARVAKGGGLPTGTWEAGAGLLGIAANSPRLHGKGHARSRPITTRPRQWLCSTSARNIARS
jgi:hypothetical protein